MAWNNPRPAPLLVLRYNGTAELMDSASENAKQLWSSDTDEDFKEEFPEEFLKEDDVEEVLDYLVETGVLSEEDADTCEIEEESLPGETEGDGEPGDGLEDA